MSVAIYWKRDVEITGTEASPQTVTLSGNDTRGVAFPILTSADFYRVETIPKQTADVISVKGGEALNGSGYVTFTVYASDIGNAASDGKYYADIALYANVSETVPVSAGYYCTQQNLEDRIGKQTLAELTEDTANPTEPDVSVCGILIGRACALIDSYAGRVYTVPFTTIPTIIRDLAIDLSCYYAFQRRPTQMGMPVMWDAHYKDAIKLLDEISQQLYRVGTGFVVESAQSSIVTNSTAIDFNDEDNGEYYF
jgi:phage gp36-like protein